MMIQENVVTRKTAKNNSIFNPYLIMRKFALKESSHELKDCVKLI